MAPHVQVPIIGIIKRDLADYPVRITPWAQDVMDLAASGASIIAVHATARSRPASVTELVQATHAAGCLSMANCATLADGLNAHQIGCELIGTTLSGYTAETETSNPCSIWQTNTGGHLRDITSMLDDLLTSSRDFH